MTLGDCLDSSGDGITRTYKFLAQWPVDPEPSLLQLPERRVYSVVRLLLSPLLTRQRRGNVQVPHAAVCFLQPRSSTDRDSFGPQPVDELFSFFYLHLYQRRLIHGSTPCLFSVMASTNFSA